jgi:putative oxidoreductase
MKIAVIVCRVFVSLGFIVFGANILVPFLPQPPPIEGSLLAQYMAVMGPTHYMKLVGLFQLLGGLFVLSGRMAPLGLAFLAPVLVNILAVHVFLMNGEGLVPGLVFCGLCGFLGYAYRAYFKSLFTTNAQPATK